jgi:DNA-binding beta-propeller fold protein YncE
MKTWKFYYFAAVSILCMYSVTSCDKGDDPEPPAVESPGVNGIYFLNSGNYGGNNTTLDFVSLIPEESAPAEVVHDLFLTKNNRNLGDTGNDMIVYGSKLYIAMSGSKTVEVIALDGTSLKQIAFDGDPRYFASDGGKVYITLFNGFVARLDTASLTVEKTVATGRNPEQIAAANNKLYIANSGGLDYDSEIGYDRTISIIDIPTFTETKKVDVGINPISVVADSEGDVYVASMGNYGDIPAMFQRIAKDDRVTVIEGVLASEMTSTGDRIYILSSQYDENWNPSYAFISFDTKEEKVLSNHFIESGSEPSAPYKISADPQTGNIYISSSDYINSGNFYEYDSQGKLARQWELGLNPVKAAAVHSQK